MEPSVTRLTELPTVTAESPAGFSPYLDVENDTSFASPSSSYRTPNKAQGSSNYAKTSSVGKPQAPRTGGKKPGNRGTSSSGGKSMAGSCTPANRRAEAYYSDEDDFDQEDLIGTTPRHTSIASGTGRLRHGQSSRVDHMEDYDDDDDDDDEDDGHDADAGSNVNGQTDKLEDCVSDKNVPTKKQSVGIAGRKHNRFTKEANKSSKRLRLESSHDEDDDVDDDEDDDEDDDDDECHVSNDGKEEEDDDHEIPEDVKRANLTLANANQKCKGLSSSRGGSLNGMNNHAASSLSALATGEDDDDDENDEDDDEPLNSGDDVSDEEPERLFASDNVVVCQYDKIHRSRNRWRLHLKDGIMSINGKDFVFQKATGEAEW